MLKCNTMSVITVKIKEIAVQKGITTAYQLQKATGSQPSMAAKWYRNDLKGITFDSLNLLCKTLGCTPNDLLEYQPDKD